MQCVVLCWVVLWCVVLCCVMLYCIVIAVLYCIVLYCFEIFHLQVSDFGYTIEFVIPAKQQKQCMVFCDNELALFFARSSFSLVTFPFLIFFFSRIYRRPHYLQFLFH